MSAKDSSYYREYQQGQDERQESERILGQIADTVLAHHPKPKTKAAKRRIRRDKRKVKDAAK